MSPIDETVDDFVLILFANKVVKDDKSLTFISLESLIQRNDFSRSLDDGISNFGIHSGCKIIQKELIFVLVEIFCKKKNFIEMKQIINHVKKGVCFSTS